MFEKNDLWTWAGICESSQSQPEVGEIKRRAPNGPLRLQKLVDHFRYMLFVNRAG